MTYKQIEQSRELRLWLGQIIIPAIGLGITIMTIPEVRQAVVDKFSNMKRTIDSKFKKEGS